MKGTIKSMVRPLTEPAYGEAGTIFMQPPSYIDKIKGMIGRCITLDIAIPTEWVEEYNKSIKK